MGRSFQRRVEPPVEPVDTVKAKPAKAKSKPAPELTPEQALAADNIRLEAERVRLLAQPRTVANQIDHQWVSIKLLSNLRSLAMGQSDVSSIVSLTNAIDKCENALRGLQKIKIDDELEAIVARIQGQDEACDILAAAEED